MTNDQERQAFEAEFLRLADEWHKDTDHLSSPSRVAMHPAYQRIITKGEAALHYILKDLKSRGGQWYWALEVISGGQPDIPDDMQGVRSFIDNAWLNWGRQHRYID